MRQFYVSDPELFNIKIDAADFKLYEYFCRNYDLKRLNAYVRMVDAADKFKVPLPPGNNEFMSRQSIYDVAFDEFAKNEEKILALEGKVSQNQRELTPSSLILMRDFNIILHRSELNRTIVIANRADNYDDFKAGFFREILKGKKKLLKWQDEGLLKYYNQILSSATANRGAAGSELKNYELLLKDDGTFSFQEKTPERKFRTRVLNQTTGKFENKDKKGTPGYQKRTMFDHTLDATGLFHWLSGSDVRQQTPIKNEFGEIEGYNIKPTYGFMSPARKDARDVIEDFDKYLIIV